MSLSFPNPSRSYDSQSSRIRFLGHDGMFQISFSITVDALSERNSGPLDGEADFLRAFDAGHEFIQEIARKAYAKTRKSSYAFTAADI